MNFSAISRETFLGRMLRLPLRLIPDHAQMRILQGPLRGKKWIAGSGNHGCWLGSYEYAKQKAFAAAVCAGDIVYDLGANVGFYSLLASVLAGPQGRVYSFEPVPENLDFLRKHLAMNQVTNCVIFALAVSDSRGTANFAFGLDSCSGGLRAGSGNSMAVQTVALDDMVAAGEILAPSVIKCDIEGGEFAALKGAARTLVAAAPKIFLATHGQEAHQRCCKFLSDLGYTLTSLDEHPLDFSSEILAVPHQKRVGAAVRSVER
jgi:FkbM family methyltransferase